jgi:hypothetical protein
VAERAASLVRAVANGDGPSPARGECVRVRARELAQRLSGTAGVLLLWHPEIERVELSVRDLASGAGFRIEVAPASALDAFDHLYAYVARRKNSKRVVRSETTIVNG